MLEKWGEWIKSRWRILVPQDDTILKYMTAYQVKAVVMLQVVSEA
jgi:hypothetical protein